MVAANTSNDILIARPAIPLCGELRVAGDKSISHRALLLAAIAEGKSSIEGLLQSSDVLATQSALSALGVRMEWQERQLCVYGSGLCGLQAAKEPLYLGNSGTAARLFTGLLSGQQFASRLLGDASLQSRPMQRVTEPLQQMGANVSTTAAGTMPLEIIPTDHLHGIVWQSKVPSAQVKSAILLAGLYATEATTVIECTAVRDHTERMLASFGHAPTVTDNRITITPAQRLQACKLTIPADISSAAFFIVAATLLPGSDLLLSGVGVNPRRDAVIHILRQMGGNIELHNTRTQGNEEVADIRVRSASLQGIDIPRQRVAAAIDEFPVLLIAAAHAAGRTRLRGAAELRIKESDRIASMARGLQNLGVQVTTSADGITVAGGSLQSATVDSYGDHRIAMAFAIAGMVSTPVRITDCANIATSYPEFITHARQLGMDIHAAAENDTG